MSNGSNADKLSKILGFDPAKSSGGASDALKDALAELKAERDVENKAKAKELVKKALEIRTKMDKARKEFESNAAKFDKELGKLIRTIEAMASGSDIDSEDPKAAAE